jgi:hypothetical protein
VSVAAVALAAIGCLAAGCGTTNQGTAPTTTSAPSPAPPVALAALDGLLLSADEVNTAMGATGMTGKAYDTMGDDSAGVSDNACLSIAGPVQKLVYTGRRHGSRRKDTTVGGVSRDQHPGLAAMTAIPWSSTSCEPSAP